MKPRSLFQCIPRQTEEQIGTMREAIDRKTTNHAVSVAGVVQQYDDILKAPVEDSVFCQPVRKNLPQITGLFGRLFHCSLASATHVVQL